MRVLFLQRQPCVRALKYAAALRAATPDLTLAFGYQGRTFDAYYGSGDDLVDDWRDLGGEERPVEPLSRVLDDFAPDVVHSHNLPDSLTVLALQLVDGRVPVVHDVHDLQSLRSTPYRDGFPEPADPLGLERLALEGADAVITVSDELLDVLNGAYGLPAQTLVVPNLALRRDLPELAEHPVGDGTPRLVYEGSLSADGGHYDLRKIFQAIVLDGATLDVHPNRPAPEYRRIAARRPGMRVHEPLPPSELMRALPGHDAGWAGFNSALNAAHLDTVLPNKLFEYLAAGLPVLTLVGHRALARFVREEGVGAVLDDASHVAGAMRELDLPELRRHVVAVRKRFTFEARIGAVIDLYRALLEPQAALPLESPSAA